ncbi:MAG: DNA replication protein [Rhodospirillales bacterium]|nr:DNA replication protein [Rhodospirillales bacterium]MBT4039049.1 DNA replication protein [Rhodospirillales bacterium]MBT4625361.1 DNA replication protein [Rhodospirillales bacterium]MBT5351827.1 DNA replication protein [Rhodospirillales bacterium]MBT5520916.1 DNA replication protein [Rhodospirillales bacterium]
MSPARQLTFDLDHRPALSGDDFLVASANEAAIKWIDQWPTWPAQAVAISGPSGCGKTHLAHVFQARSNAGYVTGNAISESTARSLVSDHPALVIDDADDLSSPEQEKGLFHVLNILKEQNKQALLLAKVPPSQWTSNLADLQSRLNALPHAAIDNPDEMLITAVMVKQFSDRQLRIEPGVIDYLLPRMERSFAAAQRIVTAVDEAALAEHRKITVPLVSAVLKSVND